MAKKSQSDTAPQDAVGALELSQKWLKRGDWQGKALGEIVFLSFELGVNCGTPWLPKPGGGDAELLYTAFELVWRSILLKDFGPQEAIARGFPPRELLDPVEVAFQAGEAVERLRSRELELMQRRKGKKNTGAFYCIAMDLIARGKKPGIAYLNAKQLCEKRGKLVPSNVAWRKWLSDHKM